MNIGTITCIMMAVIFLIFSITFALLKEKGAMLISGFNTMSKRQREKYDKLKMSQDMRNDLLIWSMIFFIGGLISYFITQYIAIISFIVWLILFFRKFHYDPKKAFSKYELK